VTCAVLLLIVAAELFLPVKINEPAEHVSEINETLGNHDWLNLSDPNASNDNSFSRIFRSDLFKSAAPLNDKPMADKTIEKIRSQLKLQCVMEINGQTIAYINISGVGLKKCSVGDTVNDLFTVLNIEKDNVEISILEHKVNLNI
jgi:hypothetical protein